MNTTLKIVGPFTEFFCPYTVPRMNHRGDICPARRKGLKSKRRVENIHPPPPKGFFPLLKFGTLCKRMVSPASVRDAHSLKRVNHNIRSVKPPCRVSEPSR